MRLTLETINAIHRPLCVYLFIMIMNYITKLLLTQALGFRRKRIGGFTYWYKDYTKKMHIFSKKSNDNNIMKKSSRKLPLVFIHGLGQGLIHYLNFISDIKNRDVFLLELSYISSRVGEHVPESKEVADTLSIILQEHNYSRAIFMGHSFGTFTITWCMKFHPNIVHSIMLIDPVTLLVCYPTTCYTFQYKKPDNIMSWIRSIAVSKELGVTRVMRRHFWWQDNCLFVEDIPTLSTNLQEQDVTYFDTPTSIGLGTRTKFTKNNDTKSSKTNEGALYLPFTPIPTEIDVYGIFRKVLGYPGKYCYVEPISIYKTADDTIDAYRSIVPCSISNTNTKNTNNNSYINITNISYNKDQYLETYQSPNKYTNNNNNQYIDKYKQSYITEYYNSKILPVSSSSYYEQEYKDDKYSPIGNIKNKMNINSINKEEKQFISIDGIEDAQYRQELYIPNNFEFNKNKNISKKTQKVQIKAGIFLAGKDDQISAERIYKYLCMYYRNYFSKELQALGINSTNSPIDKIPKNYQELQHLWKEYTNHNGDEYHELGSKCSTSMLNRMIRTRVLYEPEYKHGAILFSKRARGNIMNIVRWLADEE